VEKLAKTFEIYKCASLTLIVLLLAGILASQLGRIGGPARVRIQGGTVDIEVQNTVDVRGTVDVEVQNTVDVQGIVSIRR
jgi:hypothetical protein